MNKFNLLIAYIKDFIVEPIGLVLLFFLIMGYKQFICFIRITTISSTVKTAYYDIKVYPQYVR